MSKLSEQIRQEYREAVASAVEGKDDIQAWGKVYQSLSQSIFSAWLSSVAKNTEGIEECDVAKLIFAKPDCGAGKDTAPGFQPGNTCAGEGGEGGAGEDKPKPSLFMSSVFLQSSPKLLAKIYGAEEVFKDSPGGMWEIHERERVLSKDTGKRSYEEDYDLNKRIHPELSEEELREKTLWDLSGRYMGASTLTLRGVSVDPEILEFVTGLNNEERELSEPRTQKLVDSMKKDGWKEGSAIYIAVLSDGDVRIMEGNRRNVASIEAGLDRVRLEINYHVGAEKLDPEEYRHDIFHPENLWKYIEQLRSEDKSEYKKTFASDCGAGKEGSQGFQPGNTCAGDGGGEEKPKAKKPKAKKLRAGNYMYGDWEIELVSREYAGGEPYWKIFAPHHPDEDYYESWMESLDTKRGALEYIDWRVSERGESYYFEPEEEQGDGDGQAESGEPSHQTSTPEFKSWFGDSKVVDDNGKPLVVYHGSSMEFTEFDEQFTGIMHPSPDGLPLAGSGFAMTPSQDEAEQYGENVMALYVSIKNPVVYYMPDSVTQDDVDELRNTIEMEKMEDSTVDGLLLYDSDTGDLHEIIAFDPTQIKSATGNKGDFDPDNPKITHAKEGCGAGKEGNKGFQPGNTCAGEGGGQRKRVTDNDLSDAETHLVGAIRDTAFTKGDDDASLRAEDVVQALWEDKEYAIDLMLTEFEDVLYDDEGNDLIKWHTEGDDVIEKLKDYYYTLTQDWLKERYPDSKSITVYRGDFADSHGDYTSPQFVTTDISKAQKFAEGKLGDKVGERTVMSYEVSLEDILMCQECMPRSFEEDAFLVSPDALKIGGSKQTSSPEFKSWFGDSKVVDESGEPKVLYHGSDVKFDEFMDVGKSNSRLLGDGFYFTDNKEYAEAYGKYVYEVYLKIENPRTDIVEGEQGWLPGKSESHDGAIVAGLPGASVSNPVYFVSNPTQIKSATGNKGDFDPENPKITHAKSDCGAGKDASPGFQPGNTCAGEGGGAESGESSKYGSKKYDENLKNWMGNSHRYAYGADGKPHVFYIGTTEKKLEDFELSAIMGDMGVWATTNEQNALTYTGLTPEERDDVQLDKQIHYVHLKLENPLVIDVNDNPWDLIKISDELWQKIQSDIKDGYTFREGEEYIVYDNFMGITGPTTKTGHIAKWAKEKGGYDSVVFKNIWDYGGETLTGLTPSSDTIVVFDAKQIKDAYDNKGTFDPDDPKTTHKREFARDRDIQEEFAFMFDEFSIDFDFDSAPNKRALADLEGRIPMLRMKVEEMERVANNMAMGIVSHERLNIIPSLERTSHAMKASLRNVFWVSQRDEKDPDYDEKTWKQVVVDLKDLLANAIRGVSPDTALNLPDFINEARQISAMNLVDSRLETIYRTNIMTSANEGVMAVLRSDEGQDAFPLVMITEIVDDRSRPHHSVMDGYITTPGEMDRQNLRPPNGYNCRGTLIKIDWDSADDMGLLDDNGKPDMIAINKKNTPVQLGLIRAGIYPDEGFKRGNFA